MARKAAFIDRDGVLNEDTGYVWRIEDFRLLPGAIDGLQTLQQDGYALVVVTNQAGIARGLYTEADFAALTTHMTSTLDAAGVSLTAVYHCPHHPAAGRGAYRQTCECRKPAPGMLTRAAAEHGLDLASSILVGDKRSDIEAGRAAGLRLNLLVESGHPVSAADRALADVCLPDLAAAARWIRTTLTSAG